MSNIKYAMVIDQRRCIGCHTCAVACKSENNMPNGATMWLNRVITEGSTVTDLPTGIPVDNMCDMNDYNRVNGTVRMDFLTRACQHCTDAPCAAACMYGATTILENGIVNVDTTKCIGCLLCMDACPYENGTMRVYIKDPAFTTDTNFGNQDVYPTLNKTVKKCSFCSHRKLAEGEKPFCVDHCPGKARYFGNINDMNSDVYKLTHGSRKVRQPFETKPGYEKPASSVYFLEP